MSIDANEVEKLQGLLLYRSAKHSDCEKLTLRENYGQVLPYVSMILHTAFVLFLRHLTSNPSMFQVMKENRLGGAAVSFGLDASARSELSPSDVLGRFRSPSRAEAALSLKIKIKLS